MKPDTGRGACILPHGVLFRGNAEYIIRRHIVERHYLKGVVGLPPNLFYGTGIPACILILDKRNTDHREGIFFIDAKDGFMKDGNKNRPQRGGHPPLGGGEEMDGCHYVILYGGDAAGDAATIRRHHRRLGTL